MTRAGQLGLVIALVAVLGVVPESAAAAPRTLQTTVEDLARDTGAPGAAIQVIGPGGATETATTGIDGVTLPVMWRWAPDAGLLVWVLTGEIVLVTALVIAGDVLGRRWTDMRSAPRTKS